MTDKQEQMIIKFGTFNMRSGAKIPFAAISIDIKTQWHDNRGNRITHLTHDFVSAIHPITGQLISTITYIDPINIECIESECQLTIDRDDLSDYQKYVTSKIVLNYENKTTK